MSDNVGNFSSSVANVAAVTAQATGATSNGIRSTATSNDASAIYGEHQGQGIGVFGRGGGDGANGSGLFGESSQGFGISAIGGNVGVYAHNSTLNPTGGERNDVYLASQGLAGDFHGNVSVLGNVTITGDILLNNADFAEEFDVAGVSEIDPGTVMVLDQEGALQPSQSAYDKRVAGVVSGAGDYKPGIILDRQQSQDNRVPVALVGKVYCKVDAQYSPIEIGDLLTTSSTPGHAMKADDPFKAFGSVIGKALSGLQSGQGLIPILVALQ